MSLEKDDNLDNNLNLELNQTNHNLKTENEYIKHKKNSLWSFILSKIKKEEVLNSRETLNDYSYEYSKFREYVFLLEDSEEDEKVLQAIELCDDSLKLNRHKVYLDKKRREYDAIIEDLRCYDNLSQEDTEYLKSLTKKYVQLNSERNGIRYQIGDFDSSINKLENLEEDALDSLYQIQDAENSKRLLSRDLALIKDEKERTVLDRARLEFAYKVLHKFSFGVAIVLGLAIIALTLISVSSNESVFLSLSILCVTLVFIIVLVYAFRKKIVFELKLNEKKQAKLVALLNKKTVVYSYYTNFLNFTYKKYNVKSSRALKNNLDDFSNYKHIVNRYDNLGKLVYEVQSQLDEFLKEKNIHVANASLETFAKSINIENQKAYFKEIEAKREKIDKRTKEIDEEQQKLLDKLIELNVQDTSKERVIEKIIQAYFNETEKLLSEEDEEDIKKIEPNI